MPFPPLVSSCPAIAVQFRSRVFAYTLALCIPGMAPAALAADSTGAVELEAVTVHAAPERADGPVADWRATRSATATRTDTPIADIPRAISVVPAEVLEDLGEERIDRALDFAGGVTRGNNFGGMSLSGYNVRGFTTGAMFRNGFANNRGTNTAPDAATVERIEVLKGPDSGLFGKGEPGGLVNIVTKRAQAEAFARFKISAGRWQQYRGSADINTPLSQNGSVLARVNIAVEDNGSFRNHIFNKREVLAPTLSWKISANTRLTLDGELIRNKNRFDRGVALVNGNLNAVPIANFYGDPADQGVHNRTGLLQIGLEQALGDDWKLRLATQYYRGHLESGYSHPYAPLAAAPDIIRRSYLKRDWEWNNTHHQLDLQGRFALLGWQHQVLIGAEQEQHRGGNQQWQTGTSSAYGINIWHPVYDKPRPEYTTYTNSSSREKSRAINLQDQIHLTDRWIAALGARYERITVRGRNNQTGAVTSDYTRDAVVPRIGLLYKLTPQVNLFTNASRSFKPNGVMESTGEAYAPEKGVGYEMGAKLDWLEGCLGATIAAFHITKQNVLTAHPDPEITDRITVGEQRSQGLDLQAAGKVTSALRLIAAYSYIDAKVTKDNNTPNTSGNRLAGVPQHNASLLAIYRMDPLELGGAINHVGARRASNNSPFELPSYRTVDLFTRWQASDKINVTLNLNNLFNKRYYARGWQTNFGLPGDPRNLKLTMTMAW